VLIQRVTILMKADGTATVIMLIGLVDGGLYLAGRFFNLDELRQMSAIGLAASWIEGQQPLNPVPLLLCYLVIAVLLRIGWRRWLHKGEQQVDAKLRLMGVPSAKN